jgi:hypothetical protein
MELNHLIHGNLLQQFFFSLQVEMRSHGCTAPQALNPNASALESNGQVKVVEKFSIP